MVARLLILASLLWTAAGQAQSGTGNISGRVVDSDGGAIPGAKVIATGGALTAPLGTATDSDGRYLLEGLPVGAVDLTVSHIGFSDNLAAGVQVTPDGTGTRDFVL